MLQYVTKSELLDIGQQTLVESLRKVELAKKRSPTNATFLSHSSKDDDAVPGVVRILENHGATVYLDSKDPTLSSQSPQEIATTLRSRIRDCRKLVLFATNNIKDSKWVPWELGIADGSKSRSNVCLFPGPDKSSETRWLEQEYLGVYDRVIWGNYSGEQLQQWLVWNHETNSAIKLREWLSR